MIITFFNSKSYVPQRYILQIFHEKMRMYHVWSKKNLIIESSI